MLEHTEKKQIEKLKNKFVVYNIQTAYSHVNSV